MARQGLHAGGVLPSTCLQDEQYHRQPEGAGATTDAGNGQGNHSEGQSVMRGAEPLSRQPWDESVWENLIMCEHAFCLWC